MKKVIYKSDYKTDMEKLKKVDKDLANLYDKIYNFMKEFKPTDMVQYNTSYAQLMVMVGQYRTMAVMAGTNVKNVYDVATINNKHEFEYEMDRLVKNDSKFDLVNFLEIIKPNYMARANIELSGIEKMQIDEYCKNNNIVPVNVQTTKLSILQRATEKELQNYAYFIIKNGLKLQDAVVNVNSNKFSIWTRYQVAKEGCRGMENER